MAENPRTQQIKPAVIRRTVLITGVVMLAFSLYLLVFLAPDFISAVAGPTRMTMARAAEIATDESTYVSIEDGRWLCDTIVYVRGPSSTSRLRTTTRATEIFLTGASKSEQTVVLVSLSGEMDCAEIEATEPTGYLTRMTRNKQQDLTNDARLARFFEATDFLEICGYCGEENSFIGMVFGIVIAIGGIFVLVWGLRLPKGMSPSEEQV